jgi:microcystin-dependent protein
MSEPFLSQVMIVPFNYSPKGWAMCNGQVLPINQNTALFSLVGTTFGGDGTVNFALPNLQGRAPIHSGAGHVLGESGGVESVILDSGQIGHGHTVLAHSGPANKRSPGGNVWAQEAVNQDAMYSSAPPNTAMSASAVSISPTGSLSPTPHSNMQPYQVLSFVIALQGIYPSHS